MGILYAFIYMPWFLFLEKHVTTKYHVMQTALDERIPFIEYFIVPYLMWFAFIAVVFLYFFFTDVQGFYKLAAISFAGMTIFLIICTFSRTDRISDRWYLNGRICLWMR